MGATTPHSCSVWFGLVSCGLVWLVLFGGDGYNHKRRILSQPQLNSNLKQHNTNIGFTTATSKLATALIFIMV